MDFLKTPEMRLHDDARIQEIIDEINSGQRDDVAWAKALKSAKGNTSYAQALYIDERIQRLADFELTTAAGQRKKRLKDLTQELNELKKARQIQNFFSLMIILCLSLSAVLFWQGDVELGAAALIVFFLGGIYNIVKHERLGKRRKELKAKLDAMSPPTSFSWIGTLFVLVVVALTLGYFLV